MLSPAPIWSWTGFHGGVHVGAGWGTTGSTLTRTAGAPISLTAPEYSLLAEQPQRLPRWRTGRLQLAIRLGRLRRSGRHRRNEHQGHRALSGHPLPAPAGPIGWLRSRVVAAPSSSIAASSMSRVAARMNTDHGSIFRSSQIPS